MAYSTTMEGSEAIITQSEIRSIDIRKSYPNDFLKLCINSNDTYSGSYYYPTNNCHHFTIVFNDSEQKLYKIGFHNATGTK